MMCRGRFPLILCWGCALRKAVWLLLVPVAAIAQNVVTEADVDMATAVIAKHTLSLPGLNPGTKITSGPGPFSAADAVILYALKDFAKRKQCVPESALVRALAAGEDWEMHKGVAVAFWRTLCGQEAGALGQTTAFHFENYILDKSIAKGKRANARLAGVVAADEQWRKVMASERARQDQRAQSQASAATAREAAARERDAEWAESVARYEKWALGLKRERAPSY